MRQFSQCLVLPLVFVFLTAPANAGSSDNEKKIVRIAHWQLESGLREAIDKIAEEYMRIHPGVKIEQMAIPERIYANWFVTQLVGGTAPDIIEIGYGSSDERLARYFVPLSDMAAEPNPYNRGTKLEGVPLRSTLVDGMNGGYNQALLDYYGIPTSGYTIRLFFNLKLLQQVIGDRKVPTTFTELLDLCKRAADYAKKNDMPFVPIAGSKFNAPILMKMLFGSQTQSFLQALNPPGCWNVNAAQLAARYAEGKWSLESPEILSGFSLIRDVGQYTQSGFMQLQRDDATLCFVQGNALMICTGSWDARSIRAEADFPVEVVEVPFPTKHDGDFGRYSIGPLTEADHDGSVSFGLSRSSDHPAIAKDFLYFLVSQRMNQLFSDVSGWLPNVVGVTLPVDAEQFRPLTNGFLPGFGPTFAGPDTERVYENSLYLLLGSNSSAKAFSAAIQSDYEMAIKADVGRSLLVQGDNIKRMDTLLGAIAWRAAKNPDDAAAKKRLDRALSAATGNQIQFHDYKTAKRKLEAQNP